MIEVQVESSAAPVQPQTVVFAWSQCAIAPENVRGRVNTERIPALAASIAMQGQQQPVCAYIDTEVEGAQTVHIFEGKRRYLAVGYNIEHGRATADFPMEVKVYTKEEATLRSLIGNMHESMDPGDEFRAFKQLADKHMPLEDIAATFGVTPTVVKRRLKLANVAPEIMDQFNEGGISLDCMQALALMDDQAAQVELWNSLPGWNRHGQAIRALINRGKVNASTDPLAVFVGTEAYEAAGGKVSRDLFHEGPGYIEDSVLLDSLARTKLEGFAGQFLAAGWQWVECYTRIDSATLYQYGTAPTLTRELTAEEEVEHAALLSEGESIQERLAALCEREDEDDDSQAATAAEIERLEARATELNGRAEALDEGRTISDPDNPSGVILTVGYNGRLMVHLGRLRAEDMRAQNGKDDREGDGEGEGEGDEATASEANAVSAQAAPAKPMHSERLVRLLTGHRTAAFREVLASRTDIALVCLAHKLALSVFGPYSASENVLDISLTMPPLDTSGFEEVQSSRAGDAWNARLARWQSLLPLYGDGDGLPLLGWLIEQNQAVLLELISFCAAATVNLIEGKYESIARDNANALCEVLQLDMADWWEPSESYLAAIAKSHIVDIVSTTISPQAAVPVTTMKKAEAAAAAAAALRGKRWLPTLLQS